MDKKKKDAYDEAVKKKAEAAFEYFSNEIKVNRAEELERHMKESEEIELSSECELRLNQILKEVRRKDR